MCAHVGARVCAMPAELSITMGTQRGSCMALLVLCSPVHPSPSLCCAHTAQQGPGQGMGD